MHCVGTGFGDRFGVSQGGSRVFGGGAAGEELGRVAGKKRSQALFNGLVADARILHGKEGVDGSSPSEGFTKGQQMACFVASAAYAHRSTVPQPVPKVCS